MGVFFGRKKSWRCESKCLFVVLLMAVYWLFEVMPLAVTAMMPVFLYPILGILSSGRVCASYMPDVNFLSFGGLVVALAVEKCNLHQRLALRVLTWVGSEPKWIIFGFMSITAFLSMWMSNTACTAMMVPIAQSVIAEWKKSKEEEGVPPNPAGRQSESTELVPRNAGKDDHTITSISHKDSTSSTNVTSTGKQVNKEQNAVAKSLLLGIAYASSIGGTATLTGSPTNISMVGLMKRLQRNCTYELRFTSVFSCSLFPRDDGRSVTYVLYMIFALPTMVLILILVWITLLCYFLGAKATLLSMVPSFRKKKKRSPKGNKVTALFQEKFRKLPPMSFAETSVFVIFLILVVLWVLRDVGVPSFPGFGIYFKKGYFSDATSAMIITVLLFAFPSEKPTLRDRKEEKEKPKGKPGTLMTWATMKSKFPWDVVFLLGGGFALAAGVKESGLSASIGGLLGTMGNLPLAVLQLICMTISVVITNIASNVVTASILVPIVSGMSQQMEVCPLALILPVTLGCSYAYMLPVGTPPNAIVFGPGVLRLIDMVGAGFFASIVSMLVVVFHCQTFARLYVPLETFPEWAMLNQTLSTGGPNATSPHALITTLVANATTAGPNF
ncbi:Na sulph symp domain containing protein [Trichuris trichiura]|uniref:Na sulph symp domain containing protein n=1 Tax=Trichuris trichiura TaxID=36087 RepID=A0A077Z8Y6_TRITR|nr:Na sulph symp domain containing protein [Trichuris trichiura]